MSVKIEKLHCFLPDAVLTNYELSTRFPDWSPEKIEEKIGIRTRHIAGINETALDLAYHSAVKLFIDYPKENIDFLLFCTQSPDYFLPTSACILQEKLGLRTNIGALDFNLGCSGFVYGLALAKGLICGGMANNVLLITAETYSKHIHPQDRSNSSIFGDGAASAIISRSINDNIKLFVFGTDGRGKDNLIVNHGGMRHPESDRTNPGSTIDGILFSPDHLFMNGPEIFNFTIESVPGLVANTLAMNHTSMDEIDFFIFHQANKYMLEYLRKKIKIPKEKFYINMLETGNTVSATIPIALKDSIANGLVKPGQKIMLVGFGVGYSFAAVIIEL